LTGLYLYTHSLAKAAYFGSSVLVAKESPNCYIYLLKSLTFYPFL